MTKRLFRAVMISSFAVFAACTLLFFCVLYSYFSQAQLDFLKDEATLAAGGVESGGISYLETLDSGSFRISWIAPDGTVLYDSGTDEAEMENHLGREEVQEALASGFGESMRNSDTLLERYLYSARLLADGSVLRLSAAQNSPIVLLYEMLQPICIITAVVLVLGLILAHSFSKKIAKPLNSLDLENPLQNKECEEIMPLLSRISTQQRKIEEQSAELQKSRRQYETAAVNLKEAEQLRREFTANVTHELKTPLHTISGCAELMANEMVKPGDIAKFSNEIYREAQRMICLVDDIIKLSHLDEGAFDTQFETLQPAGLAKSAAASLSKKAEAAGVEIHVDAEPCEINTIPRLAESIIYNLADNAVKYNRPGGEVRISVKDCGEFAKLTVSDTGIGIAPEHRERIFERFWRVDKSHSKEIGGTGLGLSIVKHAARLLGAEIELDSTLGAGTTVTVRFPKGGASPRLK